MEPFKRVVEEMYNLGKHNFDGVESVVQATYIKTTYLSDFKEELHLFANSLPRDTQVYEGFPLHVTLESEQGQAVRRQVNNDLENLPDFFRWDSGLVEKIKNLPEYILDIIDLK